MENKMSDEERQIRDDLKNDPDLLVQVPAKQVPPYRYAIAKEREIKQIMMTTWGGLGDQVCGEPALRYAFKLFQGYEISLLSSFPELFQHLPFECRYHKSFAANLNDQDWLVIHTNPSQFTMSRDFVNHHFTQVVDFSTICAFQRQLPIVDRTVQLAKSDWHTKNDFPILIHPGRHWSSKTFPKAWWEQVIAKLAARFPGKIAIIGKDIDRETGTVDVALPVGVVTDLRNKLDLLDLSSACQAAKVVITNDSSPLHIAAAGDATILFIASCKEADHLMHWRMNQWTRKVEFGHKMKNLGRDGLWNHQSSIPIRDTDFRIDIMDESLMEKILPDSSVVVDEVIRAMPPWI